MANKGPASWNTEYKVDTVAPLVTEPPRADSTSWQSWKMKFVYPSVNLLGENGKTITRKLQQARSCDKAEQIINFTNILSFSYFFRCNMIFTCYLFSVYIFSSFTCYTVDIFNAFFFTFKDQNLAENLNTLRKMLQKLDTAWLIGLTFFNSASRLNPPICHQPLSMLQCLS